VIVIDASALIAYLDGEDDHHAAAERLLAAAIDDDLAINLLTLAEVLIVPVRAGRLGEVQAALRDLQVSGCRSAGSRSQPAEHPRRVADRDDVGGQVLRHDCTGAYHRVHPNGDPG